MTRPHPGHPSAAEHRAAILDVLSLRPMRIGELATTIRACKRTARRHLDDLIEEGAVRLQGAWFSLSDGEPPAVKPVRVRAYDQTATITPEQLMLRQMLAGHVPTVRQVPEALFAARAVEIVDGVPMLTRDGAELARLAPRR